MVNHQFTLVPVICFQNMYFDSGYNSTHEENQEPNSMFLKKKPKSDYGFKIRRGFSLIHTNLNPNWQLKPPQPNHHCIFPFVWRG
jgi:hypothetical protein